jgi:hypothetical protein
VVESYQSSEHVLRKFCGRCASAVFAEVLQIAMCAMQ